MVIFSPEKTEVLVVRWSTQRMPMCKHMKNFGCLKIETGA